MLVAENFRERARTALNGRWGLAVGTGFLASLLGAGTISSGGSGGGSGSSGSSGGSSDMEGYEALSEMPEEVLAVFAIIMMIILGIALLWALVLFIIGGPITLGYVKFNLNLVDDNNPQLNDLFSQFSRFGDGFVMQFMRNLFIALWGLAFIAPAVIIGIILAVAVAAAGGSEGAILMVVFVMFLALIPAVVVTTMKQYSYAMTPYILYENPGMNAMKAIEESKKLMNGNRWRLFCLAISFIGWGFLCVFTCGIGALWLKPYQEAAYAAFYREIKRERYGDPIPTAQTYDSYGQDSVYSSYNDYNSNNY